MRKAKEFKAAARQKLFDKLGVMAGATAVYGVIYGIVLFALLLAYSLNLLSKGVFSSFATMELYMEKINESITFYVELQGIMIIVGAILSTLSVAIMGMALKVARGQEIKFSDILFVIKNNPDKVIIIYLIKEALMTLCNLPQTLISIYTVGVKSLPIDILYYTFMIFGYVADIYIVIMFSQAMYYYLDNPNENAIKCIEFSNHVMRKNVGRYLLLLVSFIPLAILSALSMGLLYLWLIPYQYTTFALFYMQLKGETGRTIDVTIE